MIPSLILEKQKSSLPKPPVVSEYKPASVECEIIKKKVYRIYYNLVQRAAERNKEIEFKTFEEFYKFAIDSGFTIDKRIKRIPKNSEYNKENIIFVKSKFNTPKEGKKRTLLEF